MKANLVYLDIETIPSQKEGFRDMIDIPIPGNIKKLETIAKWEAEEKPKLIEEAYCKTSFNGAYGEIICIGFALDDEPVYYTYRILSTPPLPTSKVYHDERSILELVKEERLSDSMSLTKP